MRSGSAPGRDVGRTCAMGLAGGLIGGVAMNLFARAVNGLTPGALMNGRSAADVSDRGVQPVQAERTTDEDATVRSGRAVFSLATGRQPSPAGARWLGELIHFVFAGSMGVGYAWLAARTPLVRAGYGSLYGTIVWLVADEGVVPALGLSRGPRQLRPEVHAYALVGHWVYGAALETSLRMASGGRGRS